MIKKLNIAGEEITLEINELAKSVDSSVLARMGDTNVLVTVAVGEEAPDRDYFPLMVEYLEKDYASGKISGSRWKKREGHPDMDAILNARMMDRSIRPLFPNGYRKPVQIIALVLSYEEKYDPALVAMNAASVALEFAGLPFSGPIASLRITEDDGEMVPTFALSRVDQDSITEDHFNLVASTDGNGITMIDADMNETSKDKVSKAFEVVRDEGVKYIEAQEKLLNEEGIEQQTSEEMEVLDEELLNKMKEDYLDELKQLMSLGDDEKRKEGENKMKEDMVEKYEELEEGTEGMYFELLKKKGMMSIVLEEKTRVDGRDFDQVRDLEISVGKLANTHGSAVFQRGGTQVMSVATLSSSRQAKIIDDIKGEFDKYYMHHYVDYPFSYGGEGRVRYYPGRRAVGHGALAEKSLVPVLPGTEAFPYTIRVVSEIMSSAGSTSMASTCGSSLSLMDAGVPIKKPVGGIAVGLIATDDFSEYQLLVDMAEGEDFYGKMDFKVTGTYDGINAIQMDNKMGSIPVKILQEALDSAEKGRFYVLDNMNKIIDAPRTDLSETAPRFKNMKISKDKIGELIGPGGKNIKEITEVTGAQVDIEDDGTVNIFADNSQDMAKAVEMVSNIVEELEVGETYKAEVTGTSKIGVFVKVRGKKGLVHISEIKDAYVEDPSTEVDEGDEVKVKLVGKDNRGRLQFSMKQA